MVSNALIPLPRGYDPGVHHPYIGTGLKEIIEHVADEAPAGSYQADLMQRAQYIELAISHQQEEPVVGQAPPFPT